VLLPLVQILYMDLGDGKVFVIGGTLTEFGDNIDWL
jgi:hypothetical protein